MIKDEIIEIKVSKQNKSHYIEQGFNCKVGDIIQITYKDLPYYSTQKVTAICDYCGKEKSVQYNNYNKIINGIIHKYACNKCRGLKMKESNLLIYGIESVTQLDSIKEKSKQTMKKKYGVDYPTQSILIQKHIKQSCIEKYGVENVSMLPQIREKAKNTMINKYGVPNYMQTFESKEKIAKTNLKKYGCVYPFQNQNIKNKQKKTIQEKYGCENVFQNEDIKEKIKESMLEKYGVEHIMQNENYKNIIIQKGLKTKYKHGTVTCSKQQEYIWKLIGGKLNYPIDKLSLDIAFPKEKIYIEYNGSGHDIDVKYGRISSKDFKEKEIKRYQFLKSLGWKQIEINSPNDFLLLDKLFIEEINNAKNKLITSKIHHITIDVNTYDKQKLFKLKSSTVLNNSK